jgi:hypothetical protein
MRKIVIFRRRTHFLGRNECFSCSGVELALPDGDNEVTLSALTGRGAVARCHIEIPLAAIDEIIGGLRALRAARTLRVGAARLITPQGNAAG